MQLNGIICVNITRKKVFPFFKWLISSIPSLIFFRNHGTLKINPSRSKRFNKVEQVVVCVSKKNKNKKLVWKLGGKKNRWIKKLIVFLFKVF